VEVRQHQIVALLEHAVGDEARVRKLEGAGEDQRQRDQISHRDLELRDRELGDHGRYRQQADREDADDRQHPRPRPDHARIAVRAEQAEERATLEDAAEFESDASHGP